MSDTNSEVNTETVVDVDVSTTDDLDAFEAQYFGEAKPKEEAEEVAEEVTDVETDADAEAEDGSDTDTEEVDVDEEQEEPEPQKKNRKTAKERISELTAKNREAEAARAADKAAFDAQVAELQARLAKLEKTPETEKGKEADVVAGPKLELPDPDERNADGELVYPLGQFDPKYNAEVVRRTLKFEREQAAAEAEANAAEEAEQARQKAAEEAQTELLTEWAGKLEATEETLPDLREKIAVLEDSFAGIEPTHGIFLTETIMTLPRGPEVLYYLADNIGEAEAIVAMGPRAAVIALGEIHGRLSANKSVDSNKTKVTKATTPPVTTRGNGAAASRVAPDTDDLEAFERDYFKPYRA